MTNALDIDQALAARSFQRFYHAIAELIAAVDGAERGFVTP